MDKLYYQPSHLWKGQKAIKKLKELSKEKHKVIKQWLLKQAFWQVHLPPFTRDGKLVGWLGPIHSFIINSYYTIIKKIVVKRVNGYNVFKSTTNTMFKI